MMKFMILMPAIAGLFAVGAVSAQTKRPKKKTPVAPASGKIADESDAEMLKNLRAKVRVVESKKDWTEFNRQSPTLNRSKTRAAYTAKFPIETNAENLTNVIVINDMKTDKFYEIRGFDDFPWRPFSDFRWISDDVLQFEQWVNPSNGGRYRVNIKTGKIVAAGYVRSN